MRYNSEHKAQTRARILEAAATSLRGQGVAATGVASVMGEANLTHGGFYAHFGSKDELVSAAIGQAFDDRYRDFLTHLDGPDPKAALGCFIDSYLSQAHARTPEQGCPLPSLAGEVARMPDPVRLAMAEGMERLIDGIAKLLAGIGVDEARFQATSMMSEMAGALMLAGMVPDPARRADILATSRAALRRRLDIAKPS
jgi:TetR/AcrR family transcriptional repressor of nem operon